MAAVAAVESSRFLIIIFLAKDTLHQRQEMTATGIATSTATGGGTVSNNNSFSIIQSLIMLPSVTTAAPKLMASSTEATSLQTNTTAIPTFKFEDFIDYELEIDDSTLDSEYNKILLESCNFTSNYARVKLFIKIKINNKFLI